MAIEAYNLHGTGHSGPLQTVTNIRDQLRESVSRKSNCAMFWLTTGW